MSVQESLQAESLLADFALELAILLGPHGLRFLRLGTGRKIERQRVLDPVSTVDQLQRGVGRNAKLEISKFRMSCISVFSID